MEEAYAVLSHDDFVTVVPAVDIRAHIFCAQCPCEPECSIDSEGDVHMIHTRYIERDAVKKAVDALFGTTS